MGFVGFASFYAYGVSGFMGFARFSLRRFWGTMVQEFNSSMFKGVNAQGWQKRLKEGLSSSLAVCLPACKTMRHYGCETVRQQDCQPASLLAQIKNRKSYFVNRKYYCNFAHFLKRTKTHSIWNYLPNTNRRK